MYNWNTLNSKVLRKMGYDPGELYNYIIYSI